MKRARRRFLRLAASAVVLPAVSRFALAQTYPARPVHVIVGFPAGSTADIFARLFGRWLSERLGQPFIIDNRPGANSNIATEVAIRAPADGHTLLYVTSANALNATLYDKLSYNFIRDIVPIASVIRAPLVMVVNPSVPARTIPEFIAYARANPGKLNMASPGNGSYVSGELFKMMTGVDMVHVPYRGSPPALVDILGGQVQVMFDLVPASIEHIRTGKLRALAVTTATRVEALPGIATVGDFLPGFESSLWQGFGAPKNTRAEIVDRLNKDINAALADSQVRARLADLGATVLAGSSTAFGTLIAEETDKWGKVVKFAGMKPD